jgi:uncharacterized protein YciI
MQFLIIAYDGKDDEALTRRMKVREQHLEGVRKVIKKNHLYGAAILDDSGKMIGSIMVVDYPSLEDLHKQWLDNEPYVVGDVWREITIKPCRVPDLFMESP